MNFESKTIKELETIVGDIPDEIDYRTKGAVNEIKDQKHCGSCWAFGSCAAMESSWFLKHGTLYSLSEQCLVDCCHDCLGCHGCLPSLAFEYVKIFMHGLFETEDWRGFHSIFQCYAVGNRYLKMINQNKYCMMMQIY
ncbi:Clan CA, family C1, cathepsin F-like cysteine peptidase [Trichomonas vaginalis G3]|uniref:Clan CA, family C1, cathepsin F-like cysteine peptidase n=1 Tax=Trichomonas vaginalis (strain ATCC PRA-98 / G3) TaxID=412133 RepID=A2FSV9_TRIV3|nr:cysteine-type peptidase protein [Trichomonas vaginalis G3]EAX92010.1 Clan CA, family C1, cathepsin F-like cysteine peptidase [Trichomonas vaginalis G3]KAI5514415.1 cysteine-type peptidase protein [Trichomonas vaginalis G3]|eukprot:XP_001304940.1 Clan CA, family C1, cathepsin F-like cysteine peptidase [Trichomonas vaginalis G3]